MERDRGIGATYAAMVAIEKTAIAKMKKKWPRRLMAKHGGLGHAKQFNPGQAGNFQTTGSAQAGRALLRRPIAAVCRAGLIDTPRSRGSPLASPARRASRRRLSNKFFE
jgi:hypothetical protein